MKKCTLKQFFNIKTNLKNVKNIQQKLLLLSFKIGQDKIQNRCPVHFLLRFFSSPNCARKRNFS